MGKRWFAKATIAELHEHASAISALCCSDGDLADSISKHICSILQHPLSVEKLDHLVRVLMTMEGLGFHIIDRPMEHSTVGQVQTGFETWQPARIADCLARAGGLRQFCTDRPSVIDEVKSMLAARIV